MCRTFSFRMQCVVQEDSNNVGGSVDSMVHISTLLIVGCIDTWWTLLVVSRVLPHAQCCNSVCEDEQMKVDLVWIEMMFMLMYVSLCFLAYFSFFFSSQLSPAPGLVSILKKRSVRMDNMSASVSSEPRPDKPSNKRRVRFKVPDDAYDQGVFVGLLHAVQREISLHIVCGTTYIISGLIYG